MIYDLWFMSYDSYVERAICDVFSTQCDGAVWWILCVLYHMICITCHLWCVKIYYEILRYVMYGDILCFVFTIMIRDVNIWRWMYEIQVCFVGDDVEWIPNMFVSPFSLPLPQPVICLLCAGLLLPCLELCCCFACITLRSKERERVWSSSSTKKSQMEKGRSGNTDLVARSESSLVGEEGFGDVSRRGWG